MKSPDADGDMTQAATPERTRIFIALVVAATFFMENLDGTVIATAVPDMARSFGVQPIELDTGVSAYLLTLGVFIPISGWIADRFGPRLVFSSAIVVFTVASLLCGMAQSLEAFVALRVLQGIGGAMMVPVGRLVVLNSTPKDQLIHAIALLTWPALIGPVLGPAVGGFLTTYASWRWIFYLNLPIGAVVLTAALLLLPKGQPQAPRPFDWAGFVLTGTALFALMWAVEVVSGPAVSWGEAALWFAGGAALMVLGIRHLQRAANPMVALSALKVPTFAVTIWGGSLFRMGINAVPFLLPLMFQVGFGLSAFDAGLLVIAVFAGNMLMKPGTTPVLRRFGFRPVLIVNGLINAASIAACALLTADTPRILVMALLFVGGLTRSMQFTAINTIAFADIPKEGMTAANTLFSTAFQLAMGLGIALGAIAYRISGWLISLGDAGDPTTPFHIAFVIVALVSLVSLVDCLALDPEAGQHVSRKPA